MDIFIDFFEVLGEWLLFTFPIYQGLIELYDYEHFLEDFSQSSQLSGEISPWYWLLPPVKIYLEKQRALKILKRVINGDENQFRIVISFLDKATAWYFVSLGGWLNFVSAFYSWSEHLHWQHGEIIVLILVLCSTATGIYLPIYRVGAHHQKVILEKLRR